MNVTEEFVSKILKVGKLKLRGATSKGNKILSKIEQKVVAHKEGLKKGIGSLEKSSLVGK